MAEGADSEECKAKNALEVLKLDCKDGMKFSELAKLIKKGQVSNKEVVDTVLNLVR